MDTGLKGKRALVCAASQGLGRACALGLAREGVAVTITGRGRPALEEAAQAIGAATGSEITIAVGDITTEEGRAAALAACPEPDILVNNAGGPPLGDFRDWSREDWIKAVDANMLTPIALMKAVVDGMVERRFGRIVNITSAQVKSPMATHGLSVGARAGLTGFVGVLSRQVAQHNVTINNLLPGPFLTDRFRSSGAVIAAKRGITFEDVLAERTSDTPARRLGDPEELGAACVFLCSAQAGYVVGQNLTLDGGRFNSAFG